MKCLIVPTVGLVSLSSVWLRIRRLGTQRPSGLGPGLGRSHAEDNSSQGPSSRAWRLSEVTCFSKGRALLAVAELGWLFGDRSLLVPMTAATGSYGG